MMKQIEADVRGLKLGIGRGRGLASFNIWQVCRSWGIDEECVLM